MPTMLDPQATQSTTPRNDDAAALAVSAATSTPLQRPVSRARAALYGSVTEALARTLRTPQYLILFVSDRCWMRCAHCWFNEAWKERELTQPPLTFEEYEKLARSIKQLHFLSLTGGEAFQRDDIVELATMFRKTCRLGRYQIPTSGYRTARIVEAEEAHRIGLLNHLVPREQLRAKTMEIARTIAGNNRASVIGIKALLLKQMTQNLEEQWAEERHFTTHVVRGAKAEEAFPEFIARHGRPLG